MTKRQFRKYYAKYLPVIRGIARKYGKQDDALVEDLEQEATIALTELEPAKATSNEDAYIRMVLRNTVITYIRKERLKRFVSLDQQLDSGSQIERLATGELVLLPPHEGSRDRVRLHDEDAELEIDGELED